MKAATYLKQFGEVTDPNVKFINAGNTVVKPLAELLEDYAKTAAEPATEYVAPASKKKAAAKIKAK